MGNYIYHNPRWGKSRKSVEILDNKEIKYNVIEYLKVPPTAKELKDILKLLNIRPIQAIRKNENEFRENNLNQFIEDDEALIRMMIKYPKIIERPIIIIGKKAVIGRPPENIYEII